MNHRMKWPPAVLAGLALVFVGLPASAQPPGLGIPVDVLPGPGLNLSKDVYSVKFLCGTFTGQFDAAMQPLEGPVKPGNYQTAINVHNPNSKTLAFRKKAVLMFDSSETPPPPPQQQFEVPKPPGDLFSAALQPDWGLEIDCPGIRTELLNMGGGVPGTDPPFIKGWVVIEVGPSLSKNALRPLDVTAAYTAHGFVEEVDPFTGIVRRVPTGFAIDVVPIVAKRVQ